MNKSYKISAPYLTDAERKEVATGYTGPAADTSKLLGKFEAGGERKFQLDPMFAGLQHLNLYVRPPAKVVAERRKKGRHARRARAGNTRAIARQARLNAAKNRTAHTRRFGWPVLVPGISPGIDINGVVHAEVVDA